MGLSQPTRPDRCKTASQKHGHQWPRLRCEQVRTCIRARLSPVHFLTFFRFTTQSRHGFVVIGGKGQNDDPLSDAWVSPVCLFYHGLDPESSLLGIRF